jgi:hypothetical protein
LQREMCVRLAEQGGPGMSGHTPGPWDIREATPDDEGDWLIDWDGHGKAHSPCGYSSWSGLAMVYGSEDGLSRVHAEGRANASLIAAAPDLLAACRTALDSLDEDGTTDTAEAMAVVRRAIAKATGATP